MLTTSTITRRDLAVALRLLRKSRGLTQKQVAQRCESFWGLDFGFGRVLESQVSDFERGKTLPSLGSFLALLGACSESGETIVLAELDNMLAQAPRATPLAEKPWDLTARLTAQQMRIERLEAELSELRRRLDSTDSRFEVFRLEVEKG